jgi:hypothetical protein
LTKDFIGHAFIIKESARLIRFPCLRKGCVARVNLS